MNKHIYNRLTQLIALLLLTFNANYAFSQTNNCGCDTVLTEAGIYRPATATQRGRFYLRIGAGKTICIRSGNYSQFRFFDFQGAPNAPITIKNCGGLVTIGNRFTTGGLVFQNCRYFKVTGSGDSAIMYGIRIDSSGGGAPGMAIAAKSSDCEIERCELTRCGFSGIMAKTDPTCDSSTWLGNFTMYNVHIHHNYIHDLGGEGLYIGNSFFDNGMVRTCNNVSVRMYPHQIMGLRIHHNRIERSEAEGIQYGCAPDAEVHDNYIEDAGIAPFQNYQNNGIQSGSGSGGRLYNNIIKRARGAGIIAIGIHGGNKIFNNLIIQAGGGVFVDNRSNTIPNQTFDFVNNTMINCGDGIVMYNETSINTIANNIFISNKSNRWFYFLQGATANRFNNYVATWQVGARFADTLNGDYRPLAGSPLIDMGANLSLMGINFDINNLARPSGTSFDIGAYEFLQTSTNAKVMNFRCQADLPDLKKLAWTTINNNDIATFELERSENGRDFEKIGDLGAKSNALSIDYQFKDTEPLPQSQFYRLKIINRNGGVQYSNIVSTKNVVAEVTIYPPSVSDNAIKIKNLPMTNDVNIHIVNALGQVALVKSVNQSDLSNEIFLIDVSTLPKGLYVCSVTQKNKILQTDKFVIQQGF